MNQVVLIKGGARGIGAAIAKKMASQSYDIVINFLHSEENALKLKAELEKQYGISVFLVKADVSLEEDVIHMVNSVYEHFGHIDVLVNNAALCQDNYFQEKTVDEFKAVIDTNLIGPFLVSKYVGISMLKQKRGVIINIASTNGIDTNEDYSMDYDASKAGVISLTRNYAKALAPFVRVNAVAPGWTKTDSVLEMNPTYLKEEEKKILFERFAEPAESANVVAFLASDDASYINGTVIRVDGGKR